MSMMVSFVLSFFPRDVLDEILNLIESVSEDFPSYSSQTPDVIILLEWLSSDYLSSLPFAKNSDLYDLFL